MTFMQVRPVKIEGVDKTFVHVEDILRDVAEFHVKYEINYSGPIRFLSPELDFFRNKRLDEELNEYKEAVTLEQKLDALVDLVYILLGNVHLHGIDSKRFYEAWRRVHAANMNKEKASKSNPGKYGNSCDIVKPVGWVAPDLSDLVL